VAAAWEVSTGKSEGEETQAVGETETEEHDVEAHDAAVPRSTAAGASSVEDTEEEEAAANSEEGSKEEAVHFATTFLLRISYVNIRGFFFDSYVIN
jgi:hypothetical protein